MKIAKPLLAVSTPVGVAFGVVEAWRFHWWLAVLMAAMISVVGLLTWMTVSRIRAESRHAQRASGERRP
jgi:hypothetical protein